MTTLEEIAARAESATLGPWEVTTLDLLVYVADESGTLDPILCGYAGNNGPRRDANFIAHAREDVPKLVAALKAVEAVHSAATIHVITGDCASEQCDHDGPTECDTRPMELCSACVDLAESVYDYALENGVEHVTYPCPTITAIREALGS